MCVCVCCVYLFGAANHSHIVLVVSYVCYCVLHNFFKISTSFLSVHLGKTGNAVYQEPAFPSRSHRTKDIVTGKWFHLLAFNQSECCTQQLDRESNP